MVNSCLGIMFQGLIVDSVSGAAQGGPGSAPGWPRDGPRLPPNDYLQWLGGPPPHTLRSAVAPPPQTDLSRLGVLRPLGPPVGGLGDPPGEPSGDPPGDPAGGRWGMGSLWGSHQKSCLKSASTHPSPPTRANFRVDGSCRRPREDPSQTSLRRWF